MSVFEDQLKEDLDTVFFNLDEFAGTHMIDGKEICVILDEERLEQRKAKAGYADNIYCARLLLLVKAEEMGARPAVDAVMRVDGKQYRVLSAFGEDVYEIVLGAMRG